MSDDLPRSAGVRLSFKLQSPLFRMDTLSPTFTISLPAASLNSAGLKSPATEVAARSPSIRHIDRLSPMPVADSVPATSKSTEVQNRMIDEQLEMLGELFPEQMKKYSQTIDAQALETMISSMNDAPPVPSMQIQEQSHEYEQAADSTSDFQKSPESSRMPLSSDSPGLPEFADVDTATNSKLGSPNLSSPILSNRLRHSTQLPFSPEKPLMERRSLVPKLRVDTVNSQQYATKELQLIRRMKEQNRLKSEAKKQAANDQAQPDVQKATVEVKKVVSQVVPEVAHKLDRPASVLLEQAHPAVVKIQAPEEPTEHVNAPIADAKAEVKKPHRNSADSSMSGIVWSAVVERFSEMAQEIAGNKASTAREASGTSLAAPNAAMKSSALSTSIVALSDSSNSPAVGDANDTKATSASLTAQFGASAVSEAHQPPTQIDNEEVLTDSPDAALTLSDSSAETSLGLIERSSSDTLIEDSTVKALKRRSKSFTAISIMKKPTKDVDFDATDSNGSMFKSGKYDVVKLKRGRTVRVQSHHAIKVEGDYAAFLEKASGTGKSGNDGDASSLKSGKSNRSGKSAWSTKSGIENGCFRRGSMRSIKTGKTIATVGDVSIKDLSRGARFRHPNPFFQQHHGFRKIKAPHQAGPGMLRRKGSKIVRLSVYEGRTVQPDPNIVAFKRSSDDGETLGSTLARMKDSKKKGSTPLIGELSFENDDPVKPRSRPLQSPHRQPQQQPIRQGPLTLSKDNLAAYAASTIGVSAKPPSDPGLAQLAYAASAFMSHSNSKPGSSVGMGGQGGYPFPMPPASLPPVPMVSARGFPQPGMQMQIPGQNQHQSNIGMPMGPSSVLSGMSTSRSNILGAQMRGAQMLGASQSTISVASNKSGSSQKRNKYGQAPSPHMKKSPQVHAGKPPTSVPMSQVEDSFISLTPRSDISVKSGHRAHGDGRTTPGIPYPPVPSSSMPAASQLPVDARATYQNKSVMRSSTAPLPPLPDSFVATKPLPFRDSDAAPPVRPTRTSAHRPLRSLTVDTESAKEQAKRQMQAKQQMAAEHMQNVLAKEAGQQASRASAVASGRSMDGGLPEFDGRSLPFGNAAEPPKSSRSPFDKMASAFTPKRPSRKESASELPARVPRPPSAEPLDPALDHFANAQAVRRDSTASTSTSIMAKSKGINRIFGFGKNKAK